MGAAKRPAPAGPKKKAAPPAPAAAKKKASPPAKPAPKAKEAPAKAKPVKPAAKPAKASAGVKKPAPKPRPKKGADKPAGKAGKPAAKGYAKPATLPLEEPTPPVAPPVVEEKAGGDVDLDALVGRRVRLEAASGAGAARSGGDALVGVVTEVTGQPRKKYNVQLRWQSTSESQWVRLDVESMQLKRPAKKGSKEESLAFSWAESDGDAAGAPEAQAAAEPCAPPTAAATVAETDAVAGAQAEAPDKVTAQADEDAAAVAPAEPAPPPSDEVPAAAPQQGGATQSQLGNGVEGKPTQHEAGAAVLPPPKQLSMAPEELMKTTAAKYKQRTEQLNNKKRPTVLLESPPPVVGDANAAKKRKVVNPDAAGAAVGGGSAAGPSSAAAAAARYPGPAMPAAPPAAPPAPVRHEHIIPNVGAFFGAVIGTGGHNVKEVQAQTGAIVRADKETQAVTITATTEAALTKAIAMVEASIERGRRAQQQQQAQRPVLGLHAGSPSTVASMPDCVRALLVSPPGGTQVRGAAAVPHADAFRVGAAMHAEAGPLHPGAAPHMSSPSAAAVMLPPGPSRIMTPPTAALMPVMPPQALEAAPQFPPLPRAPELTTQEALDGLHSFLTVCDNLTGSAESTAAACRAAFEKATLPGFPSACVHALAARIDRMCVTGGKPVERLHVFYVLDSIAQKSHSKAQKHSRGHPTFEAAVSFMRTIISLLGDIIPRVAPPGRAGYKTRPLVARVLSLWSERGVVKPEDIARQAEMLRAQIQDDEKQQAEQKTDHRGRPVDGAGGAALQHWPNAGSPDSIAALMQECELQVNEYGTAAVGPYGGDGGRSLALQMQTVQDIDALDAAVQQQQAYMLQQKQQEEEQQRQQAYMQQQQQQQREAQQRQQQARQPPAPQFPREPPPSRPPPPLQAPDVRRSPYRDDRGYNGNHARGDREREREREWYDSSDRWERHGGVRPPPTQHAQPPYPYQHQQPPRHMVDDRYVPPYAPPQHGHRDYHHQQRPQGGQYHAEPRQPQHPAHGSGQWERGAVPYDHRGSGGAYPQDRSGRGQWTR